MHFSFDPQKNLNDLSFENLAYIQYYYSWIIVKCSIHLLDLGKDHYLWN